MNEDHPYLPELHKTQWVRLYDTLILGPFLLFLAYKYHRKLTALETLTLGASGIGTSIYNLRNFQKQKKLLQSAGYQTARFSPFTEITSHSKQTS